MNEEVYLKLLERLNENGRKYPKIDEVFNFLKKVFTEEQAILGSQIPVGANSLKSLAEHLGRDEDELEQQIESMADEGQIFVALGETGVKEYSLVPFVPGLVEFQTSKGNIETVEAAIRMGHAVRKLSEPLFENPEAANQKIGTPGLRTLPVEEELPSGTEVAGWEKITQFIERESSFAVTECACRHEAKVEGNPCKINGEMEACVYFGKVADYMIDRKFARRYSKTEILDLLKTCESQGLIHNINNFLGDNIVLCNCCGCCCNILRPQLNFPGVITVANSNFKAVVEPDSCIGCGECVDICQVKALSMMDDKTVVERSLCLGCGNCVSLCPSGSVSLERCSDTKPPEKHKSVVGLGV
jgi:ferredoxin